MDSIAVYVHTPFCPSKCGYCDFNSFALKGLASNIMERTSRAIADEIRRSPWAGRPAKTIFFGGGTPTYLEESQLLEIFDAVVEVHPPLPNCEITSESNPGTADAEKYAAMRRSGFNRISLGAQSFFDDDLIRLDRVHRAGEIENAVHLARDAGFENLNLDLMFALPEQSLRAWQHNLDRALALAPDHLSLYCLTIEPNTSFYKKQLRGQLRLPDEEDQVKMYEECLERMEIHGLAQYEISNFARPGYECRHNLCYWHGEEYAGYGPGAVGYVDGTRYTNIKHPESYCETVENGLPLPFEQEQIDGRTAKIERIMLGLRLNEGVEASLVQGAALSKLVARGWIRCDEDRVSLTREGRHFCSEVALALI